MVQGLFIDLEFPYAQFVTKTTYAADIVWEVVRNLECCGLKVIAITCDGASASQNISTNLIRPFCDQVIL